MVPVKVTVVNINDDPLKDPCVYSGTGVYYGDGRLVFTVKVPEGKLELEIDPACFNDEDPKRCIRTDKEQWSKYRVRSTVVDSRAVLKAAKKI